MSGHRAAAGARYLIGPAEDIPERGALLAHAGEVQVGVFRVGGDLYAYENRCPHQGGPVCRGDVVGRLQELLGDGGVTLALVESEDRIDLACPWHGWEYDLRTGAHIGNPSIRLRSFPVYEQDGDVYVELR